MKKSEIVIRLGELGAASSFFAALGFHDLYSDYASALLGGNYARSVFEHFGTGFVWPLAMDFAWFSLGRIVQEKDNLKGVLLFQKGTAGLFVGFYTIIEILQSVGLHRNFQIEQYVSGLAGFSIGVCAVWVGNKWAEKK